jgi:putative transcriptional regulator
MAKAKRKESKIARGLREAIAYARGEPVKARVTTVMVPVIDVKAVRQNLGMSQSQFALRFGFPLGTLRGWELGRRMPAGPARVLLTVIAHEPKAVMRALEAGAKAAP